MKKRFLIALLTACICITTPVYASESGRETIVYEQGAVDNLSITAEYKGNERLYSNDVYRIIYEYEERDHRAHIDIDMKTGKVTGYLDPGHYKVIAIAYLGFNENLIDQPVACDMNIRLYEGEKTDVTLAIGQEAINDFIKDKDLTNVYHQLDTASNYDFYDTSSELQKAASEEVKDSMKEAAEKVEKDTGVDIGELAGEENPSSPFVDESLFGDDEEALERYHQSLRDQGYMDAYGNYTQKGIEMMEALERYSEGEITVTETPEPTPVETQDSLFQEKGANVKETRFDDDTKENREKTKKVGVFSAISVVLVLLIPILVIALSVYIWKIKKR